MGVAGGGGGDLPYGLIARYGVGCCCVVSSAIYDKDKIDHKIACLNNCRGVYLPETHSSHRLSQPVTLLI